MSAPFFEKINRQNTAAEALTVAQQAIKKLGLKWIPIGGNIIDAYGPDVDNQGWNNKFPCEAMKSSFAAIFEKLINARDAEIALWQDMEWFKTNPTNSSEALREIAASHPKDGRHPNAAILCVSRQPTAGRVNVLVGDHGIGVPPQSFGKTIMSLMKSNKSKNKLMSGTYGCGGQAAMSHCGGMLIYSIAVETPDLVSWTFAARILPDEDLNEHSYAYLVDANGKVPTCSRDELENILLLELLSKKGNMSLHDRLTTQSILPIEHGTIIRAWDVPNIASDHWENFERVREHGFGNEMPVHLICEQKNGGFGTENPKGLRYYLEERRAGIKANDGSDEIDWTGFYQDPLPILDGRATLTVYTLDSLTESKTTPVASLLSNNDDARPIFVTLNGQTHARMAITWLLKQNRLDYLNGRLIMEINCNDMPRRDRSDCFASQREGIRDDFLALIRDEVSAYLKSQAEPGSPLRQFSEAVRKRRLRSSVKLDDEQTRERIAKLFDSKVASALFKAFGYVTGETPAKLLNPQPSGSLTEADWELTDQPLQLRVRTRTAMIGSGNYIVVNTDATDKFDEYLTISEVPSFMTLNPAGDQRLSDGRKAFRVTIAPGTRHGTSDYVTVSLDIRKLVPNYKKLGLEPVIEVPRNIAVQDPQARAPNQQGRTSTGKAVPDYEFVFGNALTEPDFASVLNAGEMDLSKIAGNYKHTDNGMDIFVNLDYQPFAVMHAEVEKRHGAEIADEIKRVYGFGAAAQATIMDGMFAAASDDEGLSQTVRHNIFSSALGTAAFLAPLLLDNAGPQPKASRKAVEEQDA